MADGQDENNRRFDTSTPEGEGDTVRILPDDSYEPYDTRLEGSSTTQRGTLYTPSVRPQRTFEPYDAQSARPTQQYSRAERAGDSNSRLEQPTVVQVRRGPSACAIIAGTLSLLAVACALLTYAALQNGIDKLGGIGRGIIPDFTLLATPTVIIDTSRPVIIEQVRALSKLETVHYEMQKVISGTSTGPLPGFLTDDKILLVAQGEVVAGIDLTKVADEDIIVEGDIVKIRLPEPEILYSKLDNDKTYVYERQTNIFRKFSPDPNLETQVRQAAEAQIRQSAIEDGILTKARANAEQVLRMLITGLVDKEVEFSSGP